MDVDVRISLQGGHVWEFTCSEDDPIVYGLVSSLPGVGVDANLPPDGLIQVESRAGHRLYFTRGSLVSVLVMPAGTSGGKGGRHEPVAVRGEKLAGLLLAVPDFLPGGETQALVAAAEASGAAALGPESIPRAVAESLAARMAEAAGALGLPRYDNDFDVSFNVLRQDGDVDVPAVGPNDLSLVLYLTTDRGPAIGRLTAGSDAGTNAFSLALPANHGVIALGPQARRLSLSSNSLTIIITGVVRREAHVV